MRLDDLLGDEQAEPEFRRLCLASPLPVGVEDRPKHFGRDGRSQIPHAQLRLLRRRGHRHLDRAHPIPMLQSVPEEIGDNLSEPIRVPRALACGLAGPLERVVWMGRLHLVHDVGDEVQ